MVTSLINMISIKWLIIFIIVLCSYNGGVGVKGITSVEDDDLELERQLKILNKTPIKTFEIAEGQIVDCVDIFKQPTFDHPLLKNHKIQLRPSSDISSSPHESSSNEKSEIVLQKVDCPKGTVPIRRTSKEDLIRAKSFAESFRVVVADAANTSAYHQHVAGTPNQHVAAISTPISEKRYYGISGTLDIYNPKAGGQSSSSQVWIESVPSVPYNTLQAGWMVSEQLFKDRGTHLFCYWKAEGSSGGGCFNNLCTGFIQVDDKLFPGSLIVRKSYYGGERKIFLETEIYQDYKTGNWWLSIEKKKVHIGYWPKDLVPTLSKGTPAVSWGGTAMENISEQSPEMGNGHFPVGKGDWSHGCYIINMKVFNEEYFWEEPIDEGLQTHVDKEQCYKIEYYGYLDRELEKSLQFGGPGGIC